MWKFIFWVGVAVIAGLVLLSVEYGIIQNEERSSLAMEVTGEAQSINKPPPVAYFEKEVQSVNSSHNLESIRISEALPIALQISRDFERDSALKKLANAALEVTDLQLAVKITSSISRQYTRDGMYTQIVDQALLKSDFISAELAASNISRLYTKDKQIKKILKARIESK